MVVTSHLVKQRHFLLYFCNAHVQYFLCRLFTDEKTEKIKQFFGMYKTCKNTFQFFFSLQDASIKKHQRKCHCTFVTQMYHKHWFGSVSF